MKKSVAAVLANLVLLSVAGGNNAVNCSTKSNIKNPTSVTKKVNIIKYKDGTYTVKTAPTSEGYYAKVKVIMKNNKIISVDWHIYDSENKIFDEKYEQVFSEPEYKQQCRSDLKGSKTYGPTLIKKQNIDKVDAVSGATWSNEIFKDAIHLVLDKARI